MPVATAPSPPKEPAPSPRPLADARIMAIVNQKGGVGKTTTAINLGTALAAIGQKVLLIDLDPQGNASTGLGIDADMRELSSFDVLTQACPLMEAVQDTLVPLLDVLPASMDLLGAETKLASHPRRLYMLRDALATSSATAPDEHKDKSKNYDFMLIDCPPSLNLLTLNALAAARSVLVPLQCEFFALEGLSQLLSTIEQIRTTLNQKLDVQGIILTMYDPRNNLSRQVEDDVRTHFGDKVYQTRIPRNVRVSEAPSFGKPALLYDHKCLGSQAYMNLAAELIRREHERAKPAQKKTPPQSETKNETTKE